MGLNLGDIIVGAGDMTVNDETDLFDALELYKPGDDVDIQVLSPPAV
jgi:S1-C subfamily serine protease